MGTNSVAHWEGERDGNESKNSWLCHEVSQKTIQSYNYVPINVKPMGGGEFQLYLTTHFCPGGREFDSNFLENVKSPPYAPCTPPSLAGLPLIGALCYVIFNTVLIHVEDP